MFNKADITTVLMDVDDTLNADISGGQAYGLHTIWFNIRKVEPSDSTFPDYTIHTLTELTSLL